MSHHVYTTPGFVIYSANIGEANKLIYIFTRDLGLIIGTAQGVRYLKSKLRYHLQHFSYSEFSVVRGKEMWRITGAREGDIDLKNLKERKDVFSLYARILTLLKRLLNGEEKHTLLFTTLYKGFCFLSKNNFDSETLESFEHILVLRILNHLGYIQAKKDILQFLSDAVWDNSLLSYAKEQKGNLVREINISLKATQL